MRKLPCNIRLIIIPLLMLTSCINSTPGSSLEQPNQEAATLNMHDNAAIINLESDPNVQQNLYESSVANTIDDIKNICTEVENIDFSVVNYSISTQAYDLETDKLFKEAYYNMLNNKTSLWEDNRGEAIFFKDLLRGESLDEEEFLQFILKRAEYHYLDFEGDGFPELVIDVDGPHIFKFSPENEQVSLFYANHMDWHLLGSGKLYYYSASSADRKIYAYEELNEDGIVETSIEFEMYFENEGWNQYMVSINESERVEIDESTWDKITKDYFDSIKTPLPTLTFDEIFNGL